MVAALTFRPCAGQQTDVCASQYAYHDRGFVHEFQLRSITFFTSKYWYRRVSAEAIRSVSADADATPFEEVKIPEDAKLGTFASAALVELRTDWQPPGATTTFKAGPHIRKLLVYEAFSYKCMWPSATSV